MICEYQTVGGGEVGWCKKGDMGDEGDREMNP